MKSKLSQLIATSHNLTNDYYLDSLFKTKKPQKFRCKTCGKWHTKQSDKKNICVDCREEWLKENVNSMEDFYAWYELNFKEKILAVNNFIQHEKENFDDDYTTLEAILILRERKDFIKDIEHDKVVNVY